MDIDRDKLIGDIAQKMNILISKDDPVFACVLMNELVLESAIDNAMKRIQPSIVSSRMSMGIASEKLENSINKACTIGGFIDQLLTIIWWQVAIIIGVILLFGVTLFATIVQYPSIFLSQQDKRNLATGRIINSVWRQLDKQTQDKINDVVKNSNK